MTLLIKGIEMPIEGEAVVLVLSNENGIMMAEVDEYCGSVYEAVLVPPHGRLIDANVLKGHIAATYYSREEKKQAPREDIPWMNGCNTKVIEACWMIDDAPTVIEAEEG